MLLSVFFQGGPYNLKFEPQTLDLNPPELMFGGWPKNVSRFSALWLGAVEASIFQLPRDSKAA